MVSEKALREFKNIYRKEYGEDISDEEALGLAVNFLTFMNSIYRPVKQEWLDEFDKKSK